MRVSLQMAGKTALLQKLAPTNSVTLDFSSDSTYLQFSNYCPDPNNNTTCHEDAWWQAVLYDILDKYNEESYLSDQKNNIYSVYVGMVRPGFRPNATIPGMAENIPSHAAASVTSDVWMGNEIVQTVIAHEVGHTLGLTHTNTENPFPYLTASGTLGCFAFPKLGPQGTDWPWQNPLVVVTTNSSGNVQVTNDTGSNLIRSGTTNQYQPEVPFDVALGTPLDPTATFEIMGYCWPNWIAPQRYIDALKNLTLSQSSNQSDASMETRTSPRTVATQPFWIMSGTIPSSGPAQLDPLFQSVLPGDTSGGAGAFSMVVEDASGIPLFTQHFDPQTPTLEGDGGVGEPVPNFNLLLPVTPGAQSIVLEDPTGSPLGRISLGGATPTVAITSPTPAFTGSGPITWTITDPDSSSFTSRVYYSPDNGATWSWIGQAPDSGTRLTVDFTTLPGSNGQGLIRVLVSDGVNTGQATSPNFSIPKKAPALVQITSPTPNFSQPASRPAYLSGVAYDTDDGVLAGTALVWTSNIQGSLGTGTPLSVKLRPGVHTITLTATDSDKNSISTTTTVTVGGQPPTLQATFDTVTAPAALNGCIEATVAAASGAQGAPLSLVQYSLNGGSTYTGIPLNALPFTFLVPGAAGKISLLFLAADTSNQRAAQSASLSLTGACASVTVPDVMGSTPAAAKTALLAAGLVVGAVSVVTSATAVTGIVVGQSPAQGVVLSPGSSIQVNLVVTTGATCDLLNNGTVNVSDVQLAANEALGLVPARHDLNHDGLVNVIDVQLEANAVLALGCSAS